MTRWVALGRDRDGWHGFAMTGGTIATAMRGADAPGDWGDAPVVRIGEANPSPLPAPVLPTCGRALPGWGQHRPAEQIDAWLRLRIAGFLATRPGWDGVICAPRTDTSPDTSHWVHISANEAISAQGFLTPRLIALLGGAAVACPEAMAETRARPERLAAHLRSAELARDGAALSGHLLGAELAAARPYWLGQQVALIAPAATPWLAALQALDTPCEPVDPETLLQPGLAALGRALGLA